MSLFIKLSWDSLKHSVECPIRSTKRDYSIDIARGFAILFMIQIHLLLIFPYNGILTKLSQSFEPAPFFLIVSGLSYEFFIRSRLIRYNQTKMIFFESLSRAIIIVSIDFLMLFIGSILWPSVYDFVFYWGVLQVIAFGYIFGYFLPKNFKSIIFVTLGLFFLMKMFNANIFDNLILFNLSITLLPKLIYFQSGRIMYNLYYFKNNNRFLLVSSILILIFNLLIYLYNVNLYEMNWIPRNRLEFPFNILIVNNVFILIVFIKYIINKWKYSITFLTPIERMGRIAFTIYFAHVLIIFVISLLISKFIPVITIQQSSLLHYIFLILIILFFYKLEKYWSRYEYIFGFEWLLRKGSKIVLRFTQITNGVYPSK
jgi:hypothetical protein